MAKRKAAYIAQAWNFDTPDYSVELREVYQDDTLGDPMFNFDTPEVSECNK